MAKKNTLAENPGLVLVITFFLLCGLLVAYNLSAHLINRGLREVQGHAELLAEMASVAVDNARTDTELQATLAQRQAAAVEEAVSAPPVEPELQGLEQPAWVPLSSRTLESAE